MGNKYLPAEGCILGLDFAEFSVHQILFCNSIFVYFVVDRKDLDKGDGYTQLNYRWDRFKQWYHWDPWFIFYGITVWINTTSHRFFPTLEHPWFLFYFYQISFVFWTCFLKLSNNLLSIPKHSQDVWTSLPPMRWPRPRKSSGYSDRVSERRTNST